jgi:hypothetical protein
MSRCHAALLRLFSVLYASLPSNASLVTVVANPYLSGLAPDWIGANPAASEPNSIFFLCGRCPYGEPPLYRLNTSTNNLTDSVSILFDPPKGGSLANWWSFSFVSNTLFSVVTFDTDKGMDQPFLQVLTFRHELDIHPQAQFLPILPADSGVFYSLGNLRASAAGDLFFTNSRGINPTLSGNTVFRISGSDLRTALAHSPFGDWGIGVTAAAVLSGVLVSGANPMWAADVLPVPMGEGESELILVTDTQNTAVLVWDPSSPLDPASNPQSFTVPALEAGPCAVAARGDDIFVTVPRWGNADVESDWMQIHGLTRAKGGERIALE